MTASRRTYTHPDVLTTGPAEGWADPETDPTRIDWPARQAAAAIPFEVIDGRPVNPCETTAIRYGRNNFGHWGEALMADAIVTVTAPARRNSNRYQRYLLLVERSDGYGWAVPGGHVEAGETGLQAAVRELAEETDLDAMSAAGTVMVVQPARYVPDPRASDEAWAVTWPTVIDLGTRDTLPAVLGGDDAARAEWVPADSYDQLRAALASYFEGDVFAAHTAMLAEFLGTDQPTA